MLHFEVQLKQYIHANGIAAEHLHFEQSCHSVAAAAGAVGASAEDFVKNICMVSAGGDLIIAIVKGEHNASTSRVGKALSIERPRLAEPDEIEQLTGYGFGGTPSFGFSAQFLIDPLVMECDMVYTGGGSSQSLVHISPSELIRANGGTVVRVRK